MDSPPRLSLVTYTYNDARLADGLLAAVPTWSIAPDEIIVVDDGSRDPYRLPERLGLLRGRARVLRPSANLGPAGAKRVGITATRGEFILSLDCDIRPHPDWLPHALAILAQPGVGLVGAPAVQDTGDPELSRWIALHEAHPQTDAPAPFLSGQLWLLRRSVWQAAGGLDDYHQTTHEDIHFSFKLQRMGLGLISTGSLPAGGARRLHRCDYMRRACRYLLPALEWGLRHKGLVETLLPELDKALGRLDQGLRQGAPLCAYFELLFISSLFLTICDLATASSDAPSSKAGLFGGLDRLLARRPGLRRALAADLARLGHRWLDRTQPAPPWEDMLAPFAALARPGGPLDWLERGGVQRLLASDKTLMPDFHYLRSSQS